MNLRVWLVTGMTIAIPLACIALVVFLMSDRPHESMMRKKRPRPARHQPQPLIVNPVPVDYSKGFMFIVFRTPHSPTLK